MNPIKSIKQLQRLMPSVMAGVALAASCVAAQAGSNKYFSPSGTDTGTGGFYEAWGEAVTFTFDAANPPPQGDVQGSVYISAPAQENYSTVCGDLDWSGFNGTDYQSIECDFKYDTTSTLAGTTAGMNFGLDGGWNPHDIAGIYAGNIDPATSTDYFDGNWHHVSIPIPSTTLGVSSENGVSFDWWHGGGVSGTMKFWLANFELIWRSTPPPVPTVKLIPAVPGLTLFADNSPSYLRQAIATTTNGTANLTWYGRSKPVTYSWTVATWPGVNGNGSTGMQLGLSLTPDLQTSQVYTDPDWSATNNLWIEIQGNVDGTVTAGIAYKTGPAANNSNPGSLGNGYTALVPYNNEATGLTAPTAAGTWTLQFTSDTDMTLTAPNGSSVSASLPSDVAALFNGYVGAFLYDSPGNNDNVGEYVTLSAYNITGVATPVNENLTSGALSASFLNLISQGWSSGGVFIQNPPNQVFVTSADAYWFSWTLPANGYGPLTSTNLMGSWSPLAAPVTSFINGTQEWNLLAKTAGPAKYYKLIERTFTKLQILLPGMTATPNVSPGYSGTPTAQQADDAGDYPFNVIVNSVSPDWYVVNGATDTIALSCPDLNFLVASTPQDLNLNNGTVTFSVVFLADGSSQITATDTTDGTKTAAVSPTVTY
jgi:hypothetical protein